MSNDNSFAATRTRRTTVRWLDSCDISLATQSISQTVLKIAIKPRMIRFSLFGSSFILGFERTGYLNKYTESIVFKLAQDTMRWTPQEGGWGVTWKTLLDWHLELCDDKIQNQCDKVQKVLVLTRWLYHDRRPFDHISNIGYVERNWVPHWFMTGKDNDRLLRYRNCWWVLDKLQEGRRRVKTKANRFCQVLDSFLLGTQLEKFRRSDVYPSRSHLEHQYGFAWSEQRIPQALCGRAGKGNHRERWECPTATLSVRQRSGLYMVWTLIYTVLRWSDPPLLREPTQSAASLQESRYEESEGCAGWTWVIPVDIVWSQDRGPCQPEPVGDHNPPAQVCDCFSSEINLPAQ
jgi:hypothetical protein